MYWYPLWEENKCLGLSLSHFHVYFFTLCLGLHLTCFLIIYSVHLLPIFFKELVDEYSNKTLSNKLTKHAFLSLQDDGLMIMCDVCKFWQHGICFQIMDEEKAPEHHVCDLCAEVNCFLSTLPFIMVGCFHLVINIPLLSMMTVSPFSQSYN